MSAFRKLLSNPYAIRYLLYNRLQKRALGYTREHYYYCINKAARAAEALGIPRISVLEFGVAGGNGLVEIERICDALAGRGKVGFDIYGFDTGKGLPPPVDYRDFPYQWQEGFFAMDVDKLKRRLKSARLVLGDVKETAPAFAREQGNAPVGAVLFDLDYYSSTVDALKVFSESDPGNRLPRVSCYFDDLGGILSAGVSLAIREFNEAQPMKKLENPLKLKHAREYRDWGWKVYELHDFAHPLYNVPVKMDDQLPLA
jgi:hypothetical protein